jgi:UDP-glucuronate 4-epimerase
MEMVHVGKTILVTGAAGFIGSHTAAALLERGDRVVGLDNLNGCYSPARKQDNLRVLEEIGGSRFVFANGDIRERTFLRRVFLDYEFAGIVHLAALAGVRASIADPSLYYDVNVNGTLALLDMVAGRQAESAVRPVFVLASTSAVYGKTEQIPFVESDPCNKPISPYAGTKRAAELLAYTYHHLYGIDCTVLRFFTVYGPRGRPDMMAYKVIDNIFFGQEVPLFNGGHMHRDWTYIADIVRGVVTAVDRPLGYEIINLGRGVPVLLADFVRLIERLAGRRANLVPAPMPDTDIPYTNADISKARRLLGYEPETSVEEGVRCLWEWYEQTILGGRTAVSAADGLSP